MDAIVTYVLPAAQAMTVMACFVVVGLIYGRVPKGSPILRPETVQWMAASVFQIYTPALVLSTYGSKLTADMLAQTGGTMLWCAIHIAVCFVIAKVVWRLVPVEPHFKPVATLAVTFNNSASLPLLVVIGLAKVPQLRNDDTAAERATLYVFLYALVWNFLIWSMGMAHVQSEYGRKGDKDAIAGGSSSNASGASHSSSSAASEGDDSGGRDSAAGHDHSQDDDCDVAEVSGRPGVLQTSAGWLQSHLTTGGLTLLLSSLQKTFLTPPTVGIAIGCVIGLNEPLRQLFFSKAGALSPIGTVLTLLGQCSVPVANLILAGSLHLGLKDALEARRARLHARDSHSTGDHSTSEAVSHEGHGMAQRAATAPESVALTLISNRTATSLHGAAEGTLAVKPAHSSSSSSALAVSTSAEVPVPFSGFDATAVHGAASNGILRQDSWALGPSDTSTAVGKGRRMTVKSGRESQGLNTGFSSRQQMQRVPAAGGGQPGPTGAALVSSEPEPPSHASGGVSWRTITVLALTRLVLCPAVLFTLYAMAEAARLPVLAPAPESQDPVLRLVVLLEAASPCAQTVLLLAETTGASRAARDMSIAFLVIYPASLLSMTAYLSLAMKMVFGAQA